MAGLLKPATVRQPNHTTSILQHLQTTPRASKCPNSKNFCYSANRSLSWIIQEIMVFLGIRSNSNRIRSWGWKIFPDDSHLLRVPHLSCPPQWQVYYWKSSRAFALAVFCWEGVPASLSPPPLPYLPSLIFFRPLLKHCLGKEVSVIWSLGEALLSLSCVFLQITHGHLQPSMIVTDTRKWRITVTEGLSERLSEWGSGFRSVTPSSIRQGHKGKLAFLVLKMKRK